MHRSIPRLLGITAMLLSAACMIATLLAAPAAAQTRHHISLGLGYGKHLSNELKDASTGIDFTNAGAAGLAYRYSIDPKVDITFDSEATVATDTFLGVDLTLSNSYVGPGVRWYPTEASPRPFLQGNVYLVSEKIELEQGGQKVSDSKSGAGFGIMGGIDLKASPLISFPLKVQYLYAKPADDVSSVGFSAAIAFNFGSM